MSAVALRELPEPGRARPAHRFLPLTLSVSQCVRIRKSAWGCAEPFHYLPFLGPRRCLVELVSFRSVMLCFKLTSESTAGVLDDKDEVVDTFALGAKAGHILMDGLHCGSHTVQVGVDLYLLGAAAVGAGET